MTVRVNSSAGPRSPVLQGLLPFAKAHFAPDIIAGITLAALGIPEVMGYAKIIGTPVITGLYTLLLPVLMFALFGSSRHLVVSADSATAAMVAASLGSLPVAVHPTNYAALTSLVGLVAAGMLILARILRLGFLADFLSRSVLVGFLTGVGIQVAVGELHEMLGIGKGGSGFIGQLLFTVRHLFKTQPASLLIALAVLGVIAGVERLAPRFPGALIAVIGTTAASAFFHWSARGIPVVGPVPSGIPHIGLPDVSFSDVGLVMPVACSCFIVILAQSAATSRAYALRYREPLDENLDLVGLSLANAAAGCSSTFVVNGSPTKTAIVDTADGRSQLSHLTTAAVVLLVLLFFTGPLRFLPNTVLAAIVFMIGVKLIDHKGLAEIRRSKSGEFALALVTVATVVFAGVEQGIILAIVLSLLQHVGRSYRPHTAVFVHDASGHLQMEEAVPGRMAEPGLVMFWFGAELFYANAPFFVQRVRNLMEGVSPSVHWLAIDVAAITAVDFSASRALIELRQDLHESGVVLALVGRHLKPESTDLIQLLSTCRVFDSHHACLEAYRSECLSQHNPTAEIEHSRPPSAAI